MILPRYLRILGQKEFLRNFNLNYDKVSTVKPYYYNFLCTSPRDCESDDHNNKHVDFFGFERGDGVHNISVENSSDPKSSNEIICDDVKFAVSSSKKQSEDILYVTNYGKIRYDSDNSPSYHGEFDANFTPESTEVNYSKSAEQYMKPADELSDSSNIAGYSFEEIGKNDIKDSKESKIVDTDSEKSIHRIDTINDRVKKDSFVVKGEKNFDEGNAKELSSNVTQFTKTSVETFNDENPAKINNYIDDEYFGSNLNSEIKSTNVPKTVSINPEKLLISEEDSPNYIDKIYFATSHDDNKDKISEASNKPKTEFHNPVTKYEERRRNYVPPNLDAPKNAFDYVMKLRKEQALPSDTSKVGGKDFTLDSMGFRIYNQVEDFSQLSRDLLLRILCDSVLFNDHDILAIFKPFGLAVQGTKDDKSKICLIDILPELASKLSSKSSTIEKLYTVHRIDKETTGVLLLAKSQFMANQLQSLFKERQIKKTYIGITRGVPETEKGIIDIPIGERQLNGKTMMSLHPDFGEDKKWIPNRRRRKINEAITNFKVLHKNLNAALISFQPVTGVKHQIRVHTGFGLGCPILGDHKYSNEMKMAPQKLPGDMLDKLKVRQSKVRHISMHLHSQSAMIPEILDGKNIFIKARAPQFFMNTMTRLKLKF